MAKRTDQIWLTLSGRSKEAIDLARSLLGNDLVDSELLKRVVEEWLLMKKGDRIVISKDTLLPGTAEAARQTYKDTINDTQAITRVINGWMIDREDNSKRQTLNRIEEMVSQLVERT